MRVVIILKLLLGGSMTLIGLAFGLAGLAMATSPLQPGNVTAGIIILVFSLLVLVLPGALLLSAGIRRRNYARRLSQLIAMGRAASRLPLQEIGVQLGITPARVRELVLDAISQGKMVGRMDYEHGVFISDAAHQGVQQRSVRCSACGGISEVIITSGSSPSCAFCGEPVD